MDLPVAPLSASIAALAGTSNSAIVWRLASCLASSLAASSIASEREPSVVRMAPTSGREVGAAHSVEKYRLLQKNSRKKQISPAQKKNTEDA